MYIPMAHLHTWKCRSTLRPMAWWHFQCLHSLVDVPSWSLSTVPRGTMGPPYYIKAPAKRRKKRCWAVLPKTLKQASLWEDRPLTKMVVKIGWIRFHHIIMNKSGMRILLWCLFIIDFDYFIYSSCITSWLDLEHRANEAGGGITLLRWALLAKSVKGFLAHKNYGWILNLLRFAMQFMLLRL